MSSRVQVFMRLDAVDGVVPVPEVPPELAVSFWTPSLRRVRPPGMERHAAAVWWMLHHARVFRNRCYGQVTILRQGRLVHRSAVFPGWFRFPFMSRTDLQIGNTWTAEDQRGRGLAALALRFAVSIEPGAGRVYWYVAERENVASIRAAERAGFSVVGLGVRTAPLGIRSVGAYHIVPQ